MRAAKGNRIVRTIVQFKTPLPRVPVVHYSITELDSSKAQNLRFKSHILLRARHGFVIEFRTWDDTKIASASINWLAIVGAPTSPAPPPQPPTPIGH